jgi:hypothetical protein
VHRHLPVMPPGEFFNNLGGAATEISAGYGQPDRHPHAIK